MSETDPTTTDNRRRRVKPDADIVLLCNPRAGGRWRELARILDSPEAQYCRRVVTDSVEDVAPALADMGREAQLICIYGGDGTIQRILDRMSPDARHQVKLALLGGGTMNVTSRWCGMSRSPGDNFREVVRAYRSGELLMKEVPLLQVRTGNIVHHGFTVGFGPIVRVLDAYERGRKGKLAAVGVALRAAAAAWTGFPGSYARLMAPLEADVALDGESLPHRRFAAVFANVTGQLNPGVEPFVAARTRDTFYCAAYAVKPSELALALPMIARGWLPLDPGLLKRLPPWRTEDRPENARHPLPTDPRYVNRAAGLLTVEGSDPLYTVDGEILRAPDPRVTVALGPIVKLAVRASG